MIKIIFRILEKKIELTHSVKLSNLHILLGMNKLDLKS